MKEQELTDMVELILSLERKKVLGWNQQDYARKISDSIDEDGMVVGGVISDEGIVKIYLPHMHWVEADKWTHAIGAQLLGRVFEILNGNFDGRIHHLPGRGLDIEYQSPEFHNSGKIRRKSRINIWSNDFTTVETKGITLLHAMLLCLDGNRIQQFRYRQ